MSKLRCWPGAVCQIVQTHEETRSLLPRTITVREVRIIAGEPCWTYDEMPLRGRVSPCQTFTCHEWPDLWLRPITPPPNSESTETQEVISGDQWLTVKVGEMA